MTQAIITGDVIHSTRMNIEYRNWLFKQIAGALKQWDKDFGMRSETFRGDSFQSLIKRPAEALKLALLQKTFILYHVIHLLLELVLLVGLRRCAIKECFRTVNLFSLLN